MFWNNPNYKWVRKRKGGYWVKVISRIDASGYTPYWIHNREIYSHETWVHEQEFYPQK